jgi:7-dehydrocholesterol reductase
VLLVDRAGRDDRRCAAKYGATWEEYRRLVPYKIVPRVY